METDSGREVAVVRNRGFLPVLFSLDGSSLIGFNSEKVITANGEENRSKVEQVTIATGEVRVLYRKKGSGSNFGRNADHTICTSGNLVLCATGYICLTPDEQDAAKFDEFGNAWFFSGSGWSRVHRNGRLTESLPRPRYLTKDQARDRGSLHLHCQTEMFRFKDNSAGVASLWLFHDHPTGWRGTEDTRPYQAAFVG
ncbi:MAG: hypothetical protein HY248_03405, partial [Fimbriimonas ginsengisoli]|nr:hypothetical protein [Fimbriimonas ginsengisoli]